MSAKKQSEPFNLPGEIIVSILNKLDVRDVVRCRCVCRRWKDLASEEYFLDSLGSHSAPMIFAHVEGLKPSRKLLLDKWWEGAPRRMNYNFPVYICHKGGKSCQFYAQGSQNGFLFLKLGRGFSITNPINREVVRIILPKQPLQTNTIILGIFLHPVSREYCTIWHVPDDPHREYKMLNLGINPCWRGIKYPFSHPTVLNVWAGTAFVEDFFYWMVGPYPSYYDSIMAFDIKTEELSVMPLPHGFNRDYHCPIIHNADGFLSIGERKRDGMKIMIKIWTLKDRQRTLWTTSDYVFNFANHFKKPFSCSVIQIIDEEVLFRVYGSGRVFLLGNLKHGTVRKLVCNSDNSYFHTVLFHKPTLASLRKCKPVIRFDLEDKEEILELVKYQSSSSLDLNILVEDIGDLGQTRHPTDI